MSALNDFLDEHRWWPWHPEDAPEEAPAQALFESYTARMKELDRPAVSQPAFAQGVIRAGYSRTKAANGKFYYQGLTVETRAQRARDDVYHTLWMREWERVSAGAYIEHRVRLHPDGGACRHEMPAEIADPLRKVAEARVTAMESDGTFDRLVEKWHGAYLRWRPGEPHPAATAEVDDQLGSATTPEAASAW